MWMRDEKAMQKLAKDKESICFGRNRREFDASKGTTSEDILIALLWYRVTMSRHVVLKDTEHAGKMSAGVNGYHGAFAPLC